MQPFKILLLVILFIFTPVSFAWDHSFEFGLGYSHDPNHTEYYNQGVLLSGDLFPLRRTPDYFLSIGGALGQWYTSAPENKNLTTIAFPLSLRYYLVNLDCYPGYVFGSVGPAWLSKSRFGLNSQAGNFTGQWNLGAGIEFDNVDLNLRWQHFSNAHLAEPDQGFSVLFLLSIGYLF